MALSADLRRIAQAMLAFAVAVLPEKVKREGPTAAYATAAAHACSGLAESLLATVLFIAGLLPYVAAFAAGPGLTYLESQPNLTHGDFFGVGALAYVSYLVRPTSLLLVYCLGEGVVRALEAAYQERLLGIALVALPWRLVVRVRGELRRRELAALLGPPRCDEVVLPELSRSRLLEVYSVEDKPWSEYQVVRLAGDFYILATRRLVRRGRFHAYRYQFHPLEEREVIRGAIVDLTPHAEAETAVPEAPPPVAAP